MQIFDLLEKVTESRSDLRIHYVIETNPQEVQCEVLICGTIENGYNYLTKEGTPFDDGYMADFVALDSYNEIVFGYKIETNCPF